MPKRGLNFENSKKISSIIKITTLKISLGVNFTILAQIHKKNTSKSLQQTDRNRDK